MNPEIKSIDFDKSAQKESNKVGKFLNISRPPRKIIIPNRTTMCINNFFLSGNFKVKYPNKRTGKPKKEGM